MAKISFEFLREVNALTRKLLRELASGRVGIPSRPPSPERLAEVMDLISQIGKASADCLAPAPLSPALAAEWKSYQTNLARLEETLSGLESSLLLDRARLQAELARIRALGYWTETMKKSE